jgi:hypothetical protein
VVVAIGDDEPMVYNHLSPGLADLMQAWRGGLGAVGEGWEQEVTV